MINANDTVYGCGNAAINFTTMPSTASIKIINRGVIIGNGGIGGNGATGHAGSCIRAANADGIGGNAIATKLGVPVVVDNYGLIAAGGGGGGGAGAGLGNASGGTGGGTTFSGPFGSCGTLTSIAQNGSGGQTTLPGNGGTGVNGGGNGATGGGWSQQGQTGTGNNPGIGGLPGKAIIGGIGNVITNISSGQKFGAVD